MNNSEPGIVTSGVVGGVSLALLIGPLTDLFLEMGASPRLATSLVGIFSFAASLGAAFWARRKTVSTKVAAAQAAVALSMPADTDRQALNEALKKESLPSVDAPPTMPEAIPEEEPKNVASFKRR